MCGACGERGTGDWARPWIGDLAARCAVAAAVARVVPAPGLRISAGAGGWLVTGPTGAAVACDGLTTLVAEVRARVSGPAVPIDPERPAGRLCVPPRDHRPGIVLRVDPDGAPDDGADAALERAMAGTGEAVVPSPPRARAVLAALASPVWLPRCQLLRVEGTGARWARPIPSPAAFPPGCLPPGTERPGPDAAFAADVVVRLEWVRQSGRLDGEATAVRCPLGSGSELVVEVRDGHVVRARTVSRA
ncbi:hypothetical protein [Actinomadura formosensis]|uniref:hypothetical protein n=1 Tax=Actinomadura formosensis TaxID=60706 RepID=UPI00082E2D92|nr:hypothetical protein [Actinomadura formosensis]